MKKNYKICGVIPARLKANRFPEKLLYPIAHKPMIQWVYDGATQSRLLTQVIVATDHDKIKSYCDDNNIPAMLSSSHCQSGTERLIELSQKIDADLYINIQGDEPLINAHIIDLLIETAIAHKDKAIVTLKQKLDQCDDILDPNVVKVVCDKNDRALYFSRSPIPYSNNGNCHNYFKHIGLYAYPKNILRQISSLKPSALEQQENLEQLRYLESGINIIVQETDEVSIGVDLKSDVKKVEAYLLEKGLVDIKKMSMLNR